MTEMTLKNKYLIFSYHPVNYYISARNNCDRFTKRDGLIHTAHTVTSEASRTVNRQQVD